NGFLAQYCAPPAISIDSSAFVDTVCIYSSSFPLSGGTPSGGQFSGPGVSGGKFYPSSAGVGTHQVRYTYINSNGCSNSISVPVTVNAKPSKPEIDRIDLDTIMSSVSGDHYYWFNNDSALNSDSQKVEVTQAGNYSVVVEKNGCFSDTSESFCFIPLDLVDTNDASCGNNDGSATVEVVGGASENYTYQWSSGDTTPKADSLEAGTYTLRVNDTVNGCENKISVNISDKEGAAISASVTDVQCNGKSTGEISIGLSGGTPPYSVQWSTGDTTTVISDLPAGPYEVVVTDDNECQTIKTIVIDEPDSLNLTTSTVPTGCGNSNGSATVEIEGGTDSYIVDWLGIGGSDDSVTITNLSSDVYTVEVKDTNGCVASESAVVGETNAPEITVDSITLTECDGMGGGIDISVSGGMKPYTYSWSTGADSQDISGVPAGEYYVSVSGNNDCTAHMDTSIAIQPPPQKEICLVTVDQNTHKNTVVWEDDNNKVIESINIYRESNQSNVYYKVGSVDADSISYFVDSVADTRVHSWRYKLSTVDTCGNESKLSDYHETIHLSSNLGINNTVNLLWDDYKGFNYSGYTIYKFTSSMGWNILESVASNVQSYTDTVNTDDSVVYAVEAVPPYICTASKAKNFNSTRSNNQTIKQLSGNDTDTSSNDSSTYIR
ncbi:MAG: SprB repeat-containing protein, partial [Flavobacteriales bacterium]